MNFLSHFYHEIPCEDAYFATGVILPDILSNFSARNKEIVKIHAQKLLPEKDPEIASLADGVRTHYAVDAAFHDSNFFTANTTAISSAIHNYTFECFEKRLFAFSHVMLELMLDRKILKEHPEVCPRFYNLLDLTDAGRLSAFVSANSKLSNTAAFAAHFSRFRDLRFIYDYAVDDVLINILDHINRKLGNKAFSATDKIHITSVILDTENALSSQKFPIFKTHL